MARHSHGLGTAFLHHTVHGMTTELTERPLTGQIDQALTPNYHSPKQSPQKPHPSPGKRKRGDPSKSHSPNPSDSNSTKKSTSHEHLASKSTWQPSIPYSMDQLMHLGKGELCKVPVEINPISMVARKKQPRARGDRQGDRPRWDRGGNFRNRDGPDSEGARSSVQVPAGQRFNSSGNRPGRGSRRANLPEWMTDDATMEPYGDSSAVEDGELDELQKWKAMMRKQDSLTNLEDDKDFDDFGGNRGSLPRSLPGAQAASFDMLPAPTRSQTFESIAQEDLLRRNMGNMSLGAPGVPPGLGGHPLGATHPTEAQEDHANNLFGRFLQDMNTNASGMERASSFTSSGSFNPLGPRPDGSSSVDNYGAGIPGDKFKSKFSSFFQMEDEGASRAREAGRHVGSPANALSRAQSSVPPTHQTFMSPAEADPLAMLMRDASSGRREVSSGPSSQPAPTHGIPGPPPGLNIPVSVQLPQINSAKIQELSAPPPSAVTPSTQGPNGEGQGMGFLLESLSKGMADLQASGKLPQKNARPPSAPANKRPAQILTEDDILQQMRGGAPSASDVGDSPSGRASSKPGEDAKALSRIMAALEKSRSPEAQVPEKRQEDNELMSKLLGLSAAAEASQVNSQQQQQFQYDGIDGMQSTFDGSEQAMMNQQREHVMSQNGGYGFPPNQQVDHTFGPGPPQQQRQSQSPAKVPSKKSSMVFGGNVPTSLLRKMAGKVEAVRPSGKDGRGSPGLRAQQGLRGVNGVSPSPPGPAAVEQNSTEQRQQSAVPSYRQALLGVSERQAPDSPSQASTQSSQAVPLDSLPFRSQGQQQPMHVQGQTQQNSIQPSMNGGFPMGAQFAGQQFNPGFGLGPQPDLLRQLSQQQENANQAIMQHQDALRVAGFPVDHKDQLRHFGDDRGTMSQLQQQQFPFDAASNRMRPLGGQGLDQASMWNPMGGFETGGKLVAQQSHPQHPLPPHLQQSQQLPPGLILESQPPSGMNDLNRLFGMAPTGDMGQLPLGHSMIGGGILGTDEVERNHLKHSRS